MHAANTLSIDRGPTDIPASATPRTVNTYRMAHESIIWRLSTTDYRAKAQVAAGFTLVIAVRAGLDVSLDHIRAEIWGNNTTAAASTDHRDPV